MSSAREPTDVTIRAVAAGGAGVADLPDGRVVFVPRTAPGDRARIRLVKERPRWAEGALEAVLSPAAERVDPPCPLFARCGGCQLQHLEYASQLEWKRRIVLDAFERIGGLEDVPTVGIVASPEVLGYRSRVSLTLRRLRGGRVVAGFHALGRPAHVIDVEACLLAEPAVGAAWRALRAAWGPGGRALPAGGRLRLTLRAAGGGVELLVEGGATGWDPAELLRAGAPLSAVWHRPDAASGRPGAEAAGVGARPELLAGVPAPGGGTAFEQVNRAAAELLRAHVLDRAEDLRADLHKGAEAPPRAVDAYCGAGAYGRALAAGGWSVTGIELDPVAVAQAEAQAPAGFTVLTGSVEGRLGETLPADLLIVNPPRTGLDVRVPDLLVESGPPLVLYVSCDPATLARDLGRLGPAYRMREATAFDLFPQTAHVETVVVLTREAA